LILESHVYVHELDEFHTNPVRTSSVVSISVTLVMGEVTSI